MRPGAIPALAGVVALLLAGCAPSADSTRLADEADIVAALETFPASIAARDLDGACDLFSEDAVLVYPGTADRDRTDFCEGLAERIANPAFTLSYEAPEIQQIVVDGDTAAVRLIWTGAAAVEGEAPERWREQGLDVLVRDADGSWRILVSHAFPLQE